MDITRDHCDLNFSAAEMLALSRAGRVYTSALPLDDRGDSLAHPFPFLILTGPFFDFEALSDVWLINAHGMKDPRSSPAPSARRLGGIRELDFSPSELRQAYMDYARQRQFYMRFRNLGEDKSGMYAIGVGTTEEMARHDAIQRITTESARMQDGADRELLDGFLAQLESGQVCLDGKFEGQRPPGLPWIGREPSPSLAHSAARGEIMPPLADRPGSSSPAQLPRSVRFARPGSPSSYPRMRG